MKTLLKYLLGFSFFFCAEVYAQTGSGSNNAIAGEKNHRQRHELRREKREAKREHKKLAGDQFQSDDNAVKPFHKKGHHKFKHHGRKEGSMVTKTHM